MCDCDKPKSLESIQRASAGNDYGRDLNEALLRTIDAIGVRADALGRSITTLVPIPGSSVSSGAMFARVTVEPTVNAAARRYPLYAPPRVM